jgi:hypothetical protein
MKTIEEAATESISKIRVNKANLDYISSTGRINGSLYVDLMALSKQMVEFAQRWIPVEEELPEVLPISKNGVIDNKDLLLLKFKPYESFEFGVLRESKNKKYWEIPDVGNFTVEDVTHWRQIELK